MKTNFRNRLKRGETLLGTLVTLSSPEVAEILAEAGFDWLFVDMEHSPLDVREAQAILQAVGERCACVLRVPLNDEIWIKKALDIGACGIIVPQVNSRQEAERAVRFCKYPPQGSRGAGVARAHGYGARLQDYLDSANEEIAVIVQAEHMDGVNHVQEIVSVAGIDAVLVGPYDLSASMGKIGKVTDAEVQAAIARVKATCASAHMPIGIFAATAEAAKPFMRKGYSLIAVGIDTIFLVEAANQLVRQLRE
jgi:2-keto-3-deoxy-L-rhamnonate aldolase RhmA